ncbi:MAG: TIGR03546 family protein [Planctomycetales bacterium]
MFLFLRPFRYLAQALTVEATPRRMACGFALGMVVGLVPKGNLIAVALMLLLCTLRVNLGIGLLAALAFSWLGMLADPLSHVIGARLLAWGPLVPVWTAMYDLPVLPWSGYNNTVVLGSLVVGLAAAVPVARLTEPVFARYSPRVAARLQKFRIVRLLWGAEWGARLG